MVKNNQQVFGKAVIADSSEKSPQEISLEERDRYASQTLYHLVH
jgi:hypothetical protein